MSHQGPEVADLFRRYGEAYRRQHGASLSTAQHRVITAIELCRTAALGGHLEECDACGHQRIAYNSCRNRHCPKCQSLARAVWLERRCSELLNTPYFHVVFTVPEPVAAIAYHNKAVVYDILFRAAAETLRTIAADPKHLGAEIGFFAVLHTWGQQLLYHPHLHCVVPGGGLSPDGNRWIACRPGFFLPVRVLARLFRRLFLEYLKTAFDRGTLEFFASLQPLRDRRTFLCFLNPARKAEWVVYAKPPIAGAEQVLEYLGRYTHRVAILPDGFQRIRHYGFLANRSRQQKLGRCRELLAMPPPEVPIFEEQDYRDRYEQVTGQSLKACPACGHGHMVIRETFGPAAPAACDTS